MATAQRRDPRSKRLFGSWAAPHALEKSHAAPRIQIDTAHRIKVRAGSWPWRGAVRSATTLLFLSASEIALAGDSLSPSAPSSSSVASPPAAPAFAPVRLFYGRGRGAETCPDETAATLAMSAVLGAGAIDPRAPRELRVTLRGKASGAREVEGRVELIDERGHRLWEVEKSAGEDDCRTLIASLALSLRVARASLGPPSVAADTGESRPKETVVGVFLPPASFFRGPPLLPRQAISEADADSMPSFRLWAAAGPVFDAAPSLPARLSLGLGLRWPGVSFSIEGRSQLPATGQFRGYRLEVVRWDGSFVPCVDRGVLFACGLLTFGGLWGKISGLRRDSAGWFHASAGLRAGVDLAVISGFGVATYVDVEGSFFPTGIRMDSYAAWLES
ncbi:MAG: hypothetical protein U0441_38715, partial [Polyangiaceae bacterium]